MNQKAKKSGSEKRQQARLVPFRVTDDEATALRSTANAKGLSVSAYIRARVIDEPTGKPSRPRASKPTRDAELLAALLAELGKVGSNVNQIARALNMGNTVSPAEIEGALQQTRELGQQIKQALLE